MIVAMLDPDDAMGTLTRVVADLKNGSREAAQEFVPAVDAVLRQRTPDDLRRIAQQLNDLARP